ncbi:MAG: SDR family NAD(P)-dependent oxidoreductase [Candidatus Limnocylindrales bacterium]
MDLGLTGKVAVVTGGGWGIGRATAQTFTDEGVKVIIADLDEGRGSAAADEIQATGGEARFVQCDVSDYAAAERAVQAAVSTFGRLDIVANVAGAWRINYFMQMPREDWDLEVKVNYIGTLNLCRAALEHMIPQGSGAIVNIGSDAGRVGEPNQPVYSGAKAAVIGFSRALAKDVGRHGIRVNVVCPGLTVGERREEMVDEMRKRGDEEAIRKYEEQMERIKKSYPLRKFGTPTDLANMIVFVASDRAGHVTGQTVSVSGGYSMI